MAVDLLQQDDEFNSQLVSAKVDKHALVDFNLSGILTATAVDSGLSVWNSLPFTETIETREALKKLDSDALRAYDENQNAVTLGGFLIPGVGIGAGSLKILNTMRASNKGWSWFNNSYRADKLAELERVTRLGKEGIQAKKALEKEIFSIGLKNNALDWAVTEAAIAGLMYDHPFMEDYWENPVQNIGLSLLVGGVVEGVAARVADNFDIKAITSAVNKEAYEEVFKAVTNKTQGAYASAGRIKAADTNIENLTALIEKNRGIPERQLLVETAEYVRLQEQAIADDIFESMLKGTSLEAVDKTAKNAIRARLTQRLGTEQVDAIDLYRLSDADLNKVNLGRSGSAKLFAASDEAGEARVPFKPRLNKQGEISEIPRVVYVPEWDSYVAAGQAANVTRANAISLNLDDHIKRLETNFGRKPNLDVGVSYAVDNAALIDSRFMAAIAKVGAMSRDEIRGLHVAADDLALTNAIVVANSNTPELFRGLKIKMTDTKGVEVYRDVGEIAKLVWSQKEQLINSQLRRGVGLQTIAIRTNTPLATVKAMALLPARGRSFEKAMQIDDSIKLSTYNDYLEVTTGKYLDAAEAPLVLQANARKWNFSEAMANLDNRQMDAVTKEFLLSTMKASKSRIGRVLGDYFDDNKALIDLINTEISNANNDSLGNAFLTSADHFLRKTGAFGMAITTVGKNLSDIKRNMAESVTKPLASLFADIVRAGDADVIEFNVARALNASISGIRRYNPELRQFEVKLETPKKYDDGSVIEWEAAKFQDKDFVVRSDAVHATLLAIQETGRELYKLKALRQRLTGGRPPRDLGFWMPAFNPKNKYKGYLWDPVNQRSQMILANTADELTAQTQAFRKFIEGLPENDVRKQMIVVEDKTHQALFNQLQGRDDVLDMTIANIDRFKTGSGGPAIVRADTLEMSELLSGYEHYIESHITAMSGMMMYDTMDTLKKISTMNLSKYQHQNLPQVMSFLDKPKDGANSIKNILLGNSNLNSYEWWDQYNNIFEAGSTYGLNILGKAFKPVFDAAGTGILKAASFAGSKSAEERMLKAIKSLDYEQAAKELREKGMLNPWDIFDAAAAEKFNLANIADHPNTSRRLIFGSNAYAGTVALRLFELAQPIVNILSLPILTSLAAYDRMPATFMGVKKATGKISVTQAMMEGARAISSPEFASLNRRWKELGYTKGYVSEANDFARQARQFEPGPMAKLEDALDSRFVQALSKPADVAEDWVRMMALNTGAVIAKRLYPELGEDGITLFARNFMDRSVGNYHAPQRPVLFQGTMGVAMGLFQTYMVTMAQSVYRHLELRNYKALGKAALLQGGIFGTQSMPGYDIVSTTIGDKFSDDNVDLTTGVYRAFDDPIADAIVYGLPSSLGPALYSRGDLQPRIPAVGSPTTMAGIDILRQTGELGWKLVKAIQPANPEKARAIGEALSTQSVSRPIARVSELFSGYAVTSQGNTVATPEQVGSPMDIIRALHEADPSLIQWTSLMSRLMATRPLEEAKIREVMYQNSFYNQADFENRQRAMTRLKQAIRSGNLTSEVVEKVAEEYMRTGTPEGWRGAVNDALAQTNTSGRQHLLESLKPDSPLMFMIDSLDGY